MSEDNRPHRYEYDERALLVDTNPSLAPLKQASAAETAGLSVLAVADMALTAAAMVKRPEFIATIQATEDLIRSWTGVELPPAEVVANALTALGAGSSLLLVVFGLYELKRGQENRRRAIEAGRE